MIKNIFLFFLFSILFTAKCYSEQFRGIFGLKLYSSAEKYVEDGILTSNKFNNKETSKGYFDINVTDKINNKNPFLSKYWIVVDKSNMIKQISAEEKMISFNKCKNFKEELLKIFKQKYGFSFENKNFTHKSFFSHKNYAKIENNSFLFLKCVDHFIDKSVNLIISYESKEFFNRKTEYYESGF